MPETLKQTRLFSRAGRLRDCEEQVLLLVVAGFKLCLGFVSALTSMYRYEGGGRGDLAPPSPSDKTLTFLLALCVEACGRHVLAASSGRSPG